MYRNIFTCIWVICDLEKGKNKHFNIIKSSFNLLDLPFVAMLMCVKYKSFLYVQIFGWLLITASCTVCTHWHIFSFVKYVLLHAQSLKEAKNGVQNLFISLQMEFGATSWKITRICISPKKLLDTTWFFTRICTYFMSWRICTKWIVRKRMIIRKKTMISWHNILS